MAVLSEEELEAKAKEQGLIDESGDLNAKNIETGFYVLGIVGLKLTDLEVLRYSPEINKDKIEELSSRISSGVERHLGCFAIFDGHEEYVQKKFTPQILLNLSDYLLKEKDMDVRPYIIDVYPDLKTALYEERDKNVDRPLMILREWADRAITLRNKEGNSKNSAEEIEACRKEFLDYTEKYLSCFEGIKGHEERAKEILGADQIWTLANELLNKKGIDRIDYAFELYPDDYKSRIHMDKKNTLQTILQSDKLDIYQFDACLNVFGNEWIANLLQQDSALLQKVEGLFDDNKSFYIQEKMAKEGWLTGVLDMKQKFADTKERMKKLSGEEVFEIWQTPLGSIDEFQNANRMERILGQYYTMVEHLSPIEEGASMYYDRLIGSYYSGSVLGIDFFDVIGKFADATVEQEIQQKLAGLSTHFAYPPRPGKGETQPTVRKEPFSRGASDHDGDFYIVKMGKALLRNPQSAESQFFVQNLPEVLQAHSKGRCISSFSEMLGRVAPKLIEQDQQLFESLWQQAEGHRMSGSMVGYIIENIDSKIAQFGLPHLEEFLNTETGTLLVENYKETRPDLCERVAKGVLESWKKLDAWDNMSLDKNAIQFYKLYPTEEMAKFLEAEVMREAEKAPRDRCYDRNVVALAEMAETIGLAGYKDAMGVLAKRYVKEYGKDCKFDISIHDGFSYKDLFAELEKLEISNIEIYSSPEKFDPDLLLQNKSLKNIEIKTYADKSLLFEHPEKLIEGLPNLESLDLHADGYDDKLIYESLMKHKPDNFEHLFLHTSDMSWGMSEEMANELMQKYPGLVVPGGSGELYKRNSCVIEAKHAKNPLEAAVKKNVLMEYMQALPEDKRPTVADFVVGEDSNIFDAMRKSDKYGEDYYGNLKELAKLMGNKDMEKNIDLLMAVEQGKVVEYLESLQPEDRPKLEDFYEPNPMLKNGFSDDRTIFYRLGKNLDEKEKTAMVSSVLSLLQVDQNDIEKLSSKGDNVGEAVKVWHEQQSMTKASQASLNAFKEWQAKQAKDNK